MQSYYFYQHPTAQHTYVQKQPIAEQEAEFIWVECSRDDVVNRAEYWQQDIYAATGLCIYVFLLRDILNLEHP